MGLYEYRCPDCGYLHTALFSLKEKPQAIVCPKCGAIADGVLSSSQFVINGASYANRYQGESNIRWFGFDGEKKK